MTVYKIHKEGCHEPQTWLWAEHESTTNNLLYVCKNFVQFSLSMGYSASEARVMVLTNYHIFGDVIYTCTP